jgi:hypothetical protein
MASARALLVAAATSSVLSSFCVSEKSSGFRPPAVPLFVSTPFVSVWSFDATNLASPTNFWSGLPNTLDSLIRVDGTAYCLLGQPPSGTKAALQQGLPQVTATTSRYTFTAGGVSVGMRFTTPQLPNDLETMARPASYLEWTVTSLDGKSHDVQVYYDHSAELVTNDPNRSIEWDRPTVSSTILALRMGQVGQQLPSFNISARMRNSTEPHQQQDYGYVYAMADISSPSVVPTSVIALATDAQAAFISKGVLPGPSGDAQPPAPVASPLMVSALAWDVGSVTAGNPATCRVVFFVDEGASILFYDTLLASYWRRNYTVADFATVPAVPLATAVTSATALLAAADAFDTQIAADTLAAGGANYSAVTQLTYRQVFGANGVAWNGTDVWIFQKEISSDGDLSTLDVIFPSSPQPLFFEKGALLGLTIAPALYVMGPESPVKFSQPCALHSMGKWPVVDAGNGGCSMPMESTGDMMLMATAVTQAQNGSLAVAGPYMGLLREFAGFCAASLPFPAPQDMTDDFSHAPGNLTNLALKCIISIGAQAYLETVAGNSSGAKALYAIAQNFGQGFVELGWQPGASGAPGHFQFIYNTTWADSYGLMYNALFARILGLEWLIPNFYPLFDEHFTFIQAQTVNSTWCPALSSMEHDSKWDWLVNTASLMYSNSSKPTAYSNFIFDELYFFADTTSSRFPLTDHPECTGSFPPAAAADRARPVLGAFFGPLLIAKPPSGFVEQHKAIADFALAEMGIDIHAVAGWPRAE